MGIRRLPPIKDRHLKYVPKFNTGVDLYLATYKKERNRREHKSQNKSEP